MVRATAASTAAPAWAVRSDRKNQRRIGAGKPAPSRSRNLSPVHRSIITAVVFALFAAACIPTTETATASLTEQLDEISWDVKQAVFDLSIILDQPYDSRAQLYERLIDLRLPSTFAIQLDKAQRVEAPPGADEELNRYVAFLGELLTASESLDLAIATEDPTMTALAAVAIEVSVGALAVALPTSSCVDLTPGIGRDLCDPGGLDGYESDLAFEIRRFVASFRPAFRVPDTFGPVIKGRVLATLQAEAALVLDSAAARISALEPGTEYARVHEALLAYFPAATEAWAEFEADVSGTDPLIYSYIFNSLEDVRAATQLVLTGQHELVVSALPESQIKSITDIWFAPSPDPE
jgi:hypothetical protein